ncbi:MAG TPA: sigma-54 dependent transcriptional regulator [Polyangia bacterium]
MLRILIAAADLAAAGALRGMLSGSERSVVFARERAEALTLLNTELFDVVVADVQPGEVAQQRIVRRLRQSAPGAVLIVTASLPVVEDAVIAIKDGAENYFGAPIAAERLRGLVDKLANERELAESAAGAFSESGGRGRDADVIIGRSAAMVRLRERIATIADTDGAVLVTGESGVGKELVAQSIHRHGRRRAHALVAVNCAALPPALIEAELFGHERGAFTGADRRRDGRFLAADRGTLFLDEVGDLPLEAQVKLLRVLQEGVFEPVGSDRSIRVDVRVVSATNRDLRELVRQGRFREELYYRLRVFELAVPALRDRVADLPLLVDRFIAQFVRPGDPRPTLAPAAWVALMSYRFPGNVRELQNAMTHAVTLARGRAQIELSHLPAEIRNHEEISDDESSSLFRAVERFEREFIRRALAITGGEKKRAAEILGISRKCLYQKLGHFSGVALRTPTPIATRRGPGES